ncbi:MAG: cell division protein FtsL [Gammaproteobacteria bacterium]
MTEYHTRKRIDNSRLVRPVAPRRIRECARRVFWGAVLASFCLIYAWQHFQDIQLRYQLEDVQAQHAQAVEFNQQLHLEAASLSSPMRIDALARQQLGMTVSVPAQFIPADVSRDSYLAQARVPALLKTSQPVRR